jgi:hypothetical protein
VAIAIMIGTETTITIGTTTETEIGMATAGMRHADPIRNRVVKSMRKAILYVQFARPWAAIGLDLRSMIMIAASAKS